jgi:4-hydroxythreonine-4-phosphate dehydrogenase
MNYKPIIVVAGEPFSIFVEIFFKALKKNKFKHPIILIISKNLMLEQMKKLKINHKFFLINQDHFDLNKLSNTKTYVIDVSFPFKKPFEKITNRSNKYISKCFHIANSLLKKNKYAGLINGPISKRHFLSGKFLGVTEYLAHRTNKQNNVAMLIYNKDLSVSPLTTHLPLKNVHKYLSKTKIIKQVELIVDFYKKKFKKKPNIAITGLNPHCESNFKTSEEKKIIIPAIRQLIKKKYKVSGPFAADTVFLNDQTKKYDVIIGMYHDQVLTPIKTIFGFNAVNITLGLPYIRISPDHGPNASMAGKNTSNPMSLVKALKFFENK